jgi:hypothetical protein
LSKLIGPQQWTAEELSARKVPLIAPDNPAEMARMLRGSDQNRPKARAAEVWHRSPKIRLQTKVGSGTGLGVLLDQLFRLIFGHRGYA